ncbi:MAG: hypothetical protein AB7O71_12270 [Hyphomicrobiaceae bacterium]
MGRIKAVVEDEEKLLVGGNSDGLERIVIRKDQLAIELSRYAKIIDAKSIDTDARHLLDEAARLLGSNADLLRRHIEAVSEVAGLICNVLVNANSDGTYTNCATGRGTRL